MSKKEIILGTAQLGFNYGFCNENLYKSHKKISIIFDYAKKNNINFLDTANNYGNSEKNIGVYNKLKKNTKKFKIITKIDNLKIVKKKYLKNYIFKKIINSIKLLNIKKIDILLIHKFSDFKNNKKKILSCFLELKKKN